MYGVIFFSVLKVNCIFNKLDLRISVFESSDLVKPPTSLRTLTCFIFLIHFFHWKTLRNKHIKNISFVYCKDTLIPFCIYILPFIFYFHHKYFCGCLRSCVVLFYLRMFLFNIILIQWRNFYIMHVLYL